MLQGYQKRFLAQQHDRFVEGAKMPRCGALVMADSSHAKVLAQPQKTQINKFRVKAEGILKKHRGAEVVLSATPALRDWVPHARLSVVCEVVAQLNMLLADIEMHVTRRR